VGEPGPKAEGLHWIEYKFVDSAGNPVTGVPFEFTGPDDSSFKSMLTKDGVVKRGGFADEGECNVKLFVVHNAKWSTDSAEVGDEVELTADVEGYEDGTPAALEVWAKDVDGADNFITKIETSVDGAKVHAKWTYGHPEGSGETDAAEEKPGYSAPEYYFIAGVRDSKARSGLLGFKYWIELRLKNAQGNPIANEKYRVVFASGETREGTLDRSGYAKIKDVPCGAWDVVLPDIDRAIESED
jgi:hypothetical protein